MAILLRITAGVSVAWAVLLLAFPAQLTATPPDALTLTLVYSLAAGHLGLAATFAWAARQPAANIALVAIAIAFVAARVIIDLVGLLGTLPPRPAVFFLFDLMVGFALLVGLLEALPRMVSAARADRARTVAQGSSPQASRASPASRD